MLVDGTDAVDVGDVPWDDPRRGQPRRDPAHVRDGVGRGAVPIVLGGDDSIPIPVLQAYAITVR